MTKRYGEVQTILLDIDRAAEFSGDDVDQYSKLCSLGGVFSNVLLYIPTITEAAISLAVQRDASIATVPVALNILDDDATGHFAHATTAGTAAMAIVFHVGAAEFFRVKAGANQAADRTFYAIGFD
jgi:hypothetical protein